MARAVAPLLDGVRADRVLAAPGALAVGVALSLERRIPLVYTVSEPRGAGEAPGAGDAGTLYGDGGA